MSRTQTVSFIKQRFAEAGLQANSRHGQNFLIDLNLLRVLVDAAQLSHNDVVLEVGTGLGSLTGLMAPLAGAIVTVEIDAALHQLSSEELIDCDNVTQLQQDALKNKHTIAAAVLDAVQDKLRERPGRVLKLVANLPYNIATPLISNLLLTATPPAAMVVTIQKELADRITAPPGVKDYGALSVWIQSQCTAETLRIMPPEVFWPRPKVHSAIVRITLDPARRQAIPDLRFFHEFVRSLFFHRRKFMRSVLASALKGRLEKSDVDALLTAQGLDGTARADELSVPQIQGLSAAVQAQLAGRTVADRDGESRL